MLATSDGGAHWQRQKTVIGSDLACVDFLNQRLGWMTTNDGYLLSTTDGGRTWHLRQLAQAVSDLCYVDFPSAKLGWIAVGNAGSDPFSPHTIVLHSSDGGRHWRVQRHGLPMGSGQLLFTDAHDGWLPTNGGLYHTSDGGRHWYLLDRLGGNTLAVSIDGRTGWTVGSNDFIAKTSDGGQTWKTVTGGYDGDGLSGVAVSSATRGWAVGPAGTLLRLDQ